MSVRVPAWDAVVRLCHWSLAALVAFDWFRDDGGQVHRVAGYVAVGIVLMRLLWGLLAAGSARLAPMKPSLAGTLAYLRDLRQGRASRSAAHDPLGLWMVWLLWALVLGLGLTGWLSRLDALWGEDWPVEIHEWLANALAVAVVLHLVGVGLMSWLWRENLAAAMLTGRKRPLE